MKRRNGVLISIFFASVAVIVIFVLNNLPYGMYEKWIQIEDAKLIHIKENENNWMLQVKANITYGWHEKIDGRDKLPIKITFYVYSAEDNYSRICIKKVIYTDVRYHRKRSIIEDFYVENGSYEIIIHGYALKKGRWWGSQWVPCISARPEPCVRIKGIQIEDMDIDFANESDKWWVLKIKGNVTYTERIDDIEKMPVRIRLKVRELIDTTNNIWICKYKRESIIKIPFDGKYRISNAFDNLDIWVSYGCYKVIIEAQIYEEGWWGKQWITVAREISNPICVCNIRNFEFLQSNVVSL